MAKTKKSSEREVIHPELVVEVYNKKNPLTVEIAMKLLGWEDEETYIALMHQDKPDANPSKFKYGDDFHLIDKNGNKVRCKNNNGNRHLTYQWAVQISQDILNNNWRLNGETIIIGKTGRVNSGQHRLIALILAWQEWVKVHPNHQYRQNWKTEPVLETIVAYGLEETPDVTRTLDNVKPRTLADVIFADGELFQRMTGLDRLKLSKIADYAVKFLWSRTGHDRKAYNAFAPKRTHSESLEFIDLHPWLKEAVSIIYKQYNQGDGKYWRKFVTDRIHPGYAAGLLYLMAASASDGEDYRASEPPREGTTKKPIINWDNRENAINFWTELTSEVDSDALTAIRTTLAEPYGIGSAAKAERLSVFCKGWELYLKSEDMSQGSFDMSYLYTTNKEDQEFIYIHENVGGIDLGPPPVRIKGEDDPEKIIEGDEPSEEELARMQAERERIDEEKLHAKVNGKSKGSKKKQAVVEPYQIDEDGGIDFNS